MSPKPTIVFVHLYNDYSGSPNVLKSVIESVSEEYDYQLITSSGNGFLSNLSNKHTFEYEPSSGKIQTLIKWFFIQFTIWKILSQIKDKDIIYVNTLLPIGASLYAKWKNIACVCHIHEVSISPKWFQKILLSIQIYCSSEIFTVSNFVEKTLKLPQEKTTTLYNTLSESFCRGITDINIKDNFDHQGISMLCSNKKYKGVYDFIELARRLPYLTFELALNDKTHSLPDTNIPKNVKIHFNCTNPHLIYRRSSIILNLSHTDRWIETFGLTILEGMHYGLPSIVPEVGGITELVDDNYNGYRINASKLDEIQHHIAQLMFDYSAYSRLAIHSLIKAEAFSAVQFQSTLHSKLHSILTKKFPKLGNGISKQIHIHL